MEPVVRDDEWWDLEGGMRYVYAAAENRDVASRELTRVVGDNEWIYEGEVDEDGEPDLPVFPIPSLDVVGRFDPAQVRTGAELAAVPLSLYAPSHLVGGDAAARAALGDGPLPPNGSLVGYAQEPPMMLTTVQALRDVDLAYAYPDLADGAAQAPVGSIRVRVEGAVGIDELSRERVRIIAERIATTTGLEVDIVTGSSPAPVAVTLPAGDFEYKVAVNGSWDENYGAGATPDGGNITLSLAAESSVTFYYSHDTHWITDDVTSRIVTAAGDHQSELGCAGDWDPACLATWLQDPDGDGTADTAVPMVLFVHGGPWARDSYGYSSYGQWLANRGYAVLQVNYRGSTGFGKDFVNQSNHEWAGKMHDDLIDAVQWAIDQGVTTREQVAIMGGSYGGYATLVGLTFTPETFACGVDIVGPSNLITLFDTFPAYWASFMEQWYQRVGDPRTEEGKQLLLDRSPISHVDRIQRPLLIGQGANDPRVVQAESDQIVEAMQENGIPVTYVLFPDEGHGFARPENNMAFNAVAEGFLSTCLGGRAEPIGDLAGSSIQVPTGADIVRGLPGALEGHTPEVRE